MLTQLGPWLFGLGMFGLTLAALRLAVLYSSRLLWLAALAFGAGLVGSACVVSALFQLATAPLSSSVSAVLDAGYILSLSGLLLGAASLVAFGFRPLRSDSRT